MRLSLFQMLLGSLPHALPITLVVFAGGMLMKTAEGGMCKKTRKFNALPQFGEPLIWIESLVAFRAFVLNFLVLSGRPLADVFVALASLIYPVLLLVAVQQIAATTADCKEEIDQMEDDEAVRALDLHQAEVEAIASAMVAWPPRVEAAGDAQALGERDGTTDFENPIGTKKALKLIISGPPCAGKGTQCGLICQRYGVLHLSSGDMLRSAVEAETALGLEAKELMESGQLVPDAVAIGAVMERLSQPDVVEKGVLLDDFPRTAAQAVALSNAGFVADAFVLLAVPDDVLVERVEGRRVDPDTQRTYHTVFDPPPADLVDRLVQRADDTAAKLELRCGSCDDQLHCIGVHHLPRHCPCLVLQVGFVPHESIFDPRFVLKHTPRH